MGQHEQRPRRRPTPPELVPTLRLARILRARAVAEGGFKKLAEAITEANPALAEVRRGTEVVHRHKLKQLADGGIDVPLYLSDLLAIDRYLEGTDGGGLAYMFERSALLRTLAESERVAFLVGARPDLNGLRVGVDHCDLRAVVDAQHSINAFASSVRFETRDIEMRDSEAENREGAQQREWRTLTGRHGPSFVTFGSGRANPATEWTFCEMLGVEPYTGVDRETRRRLPFQFLWKPGIEPRPLESAFHDTAPAVEDERPASMLTVGQEPAFVDEVSRDGFGHTYGLCVAQQRPRGQIWVAVAGISGLATSAGARLLKELDLRFEPGDARERSPVFVAVVRATLTEKPSRPLESLHSLRDETLAWGPEPFEPLSP